MRMQTSLLALALAMSAAPLSAQVVGRPDPRDRRPSTDGGVLGDIIFGSSRADTLDARRRGSTKVPPGHLPPRGMCRVWIDGVPPGQQPAVTTCARAEQDRLRYGSNARVIYGDSESFRGRANGKFKNRDAQRECQMRDAVVVDGRVVNVCSDDDRVQRGKRRVARIDRDDDDDRDNRGGRSRGHGKKGRN